MCSIWQVRMAPRVSDVREEQALIRTKSGRYQWKELPEDHYNDCLKLCLLTTWKFLRPPEYAGEDSVSANPEAN